MAFNFLISNCGYYLDAIKLNKYRWKTTFQPIGQTDSHKTFVATDMNRTHFGAWGNNN